MEGRSKVSFQYVTLHIDRDQLQQVKQWYLQHIGLTVVWESSGYVLLGGEAGARMGFHVGEPTKDPQKVQLHFQVDDVDEIYGTLASQGLTFEDTPHDTEWGHRRAALRDPAGHTVELYTETKSP